MAENKEINLGSLLTAKKAEIKTAKDREKKDYILKTVLDFVLNLLLFWNFWIFLMFWNFCFFWKFWNVWKFSCI